MCWLCFFILVQKNDFHLTPNRPAVLPISLDTEGFGSDVAEGDNQEGQRNCKVQIIFCPAFFTLLSFGLTPMILSLSLSLHLILRRITEREERKRGVMEASSSAKGTTRLFVNLSHLYYANWIFPHSHILSQPTLHGL